MFEMYIVPGIQASHVWTVSKILYLQNIDFPLIHEEVKKKKKGKDKARTEVVFTTYGTKRLRLWPGCTDHSYLVVSCTVKNTMQTGIALRERFPFAFCAALYPVA